MTTKITTNRDADQPSRNSNSSDAHCGDDAPPPGSQASVDPALRPTFADRGLSTQCVHSGELRQKPEGSITQPIFTASTYTFASTDDLLRFVHGEDQREEYGRYGSPNEKSVEAKLAALDNAEDAILYSSGMAAIVGLLMTKLNSGDEIVFFDQCYHRSREFCAKTMSRFGVVTHQVPTGDFGAMEAAINDRTKIIVSESPTNPHLTSVDLEKFVAVGKANEVETLIDATLATPYNLRPIDYGVDYVWHSATKYLGGHNDLLAGTIAGSRELLDPVRKMRGVLGSINSGHNLYLLERGLKTFELRMQRHNQNGMAVAEFLESHDRVERVYYPGLKSHPSHSIAAAQMRGFGGLITFTVKGADWKETSRVVDAAKIARIAPSLGGVESLIEQPLVMSYYNCTPEERQRFGIADNMIRLSCGIEDTADLISDLKQALDA
ncbi:Cystathionine beta-lyase [Rubripirellula lacrimiformis]|uniref:Cystathionine beta-lyase n=1 Tax=Rubripirellula lacrimiformis TaxID=1930273 RepID=A0A517NGZ0_9BACT|nr:aminotransferase class I/II-fold pyridoxal phosphate-dependent enzyme [Rubripirellula lacrimiformis]QDT06395.1 Cystathionine beta-lyase [Rubripirellula lacrimiformis]